MIESHQYFCSYLSFYTLTSFFSLWAWLFAVPQLTQQTEFHKRSLLAYVTVPGMHRAGPDFVPSVLRENLMDLSTNIVRILIIQDVEAARVM